MHHIRSIRRNSCRTSRISKYIPKNLMFRCGMIQSAKRSVDAGLDDTASKESHFDVTRSRDIICGSRRSRPPGGPQLRMLCHLTSKAEQIHVLASDSHAQHREKFSVFRVYRQSRERLVCAIRQAEKIDSTKTL